MRCEVKDVGFSYVPGEWILRNVSFSVESGERVGLVGPSGYGKSTLARIIAGYLHPVEGQVLIDGKPLPATGYCPIQHIYQHPDRALDPHWTMKRILREAWDPDDDFLADLGIRKEWLTRYPSELSGGQMQRFCIARILGPQTSFILADEISTMLDTLTQARIWQLLLEQVNKRNLGLMVITHDEELAKRVCDRSIDLRELNHAVIEPTSV